MKKEESSENNAPAPAMHKAVFAERKGFDLLI